jgi:cytochrome c biogenesis protein CcmG, thiol:disulfide interchange protein DsbE
MKNLLTALMMGIASLAYAQEATPSITLKTMDDKEVKLTDVAKKGRITVVSFWATWCAPCQKELDNVGKNYGTWQKKYKTDVIAITIDNDKAFPKVKPLVAKKGWAYQVLWDNAGAWKSQLNIPSVPYTLVIKNGKIIYRHAGYKEGDEKELEKKLAEWSK